MSMLIYSPSVLAASTLIVAYKKRFRKSTSSNENDKSNAIVLHQELEQLT
jgi:hypothetical protein